MSYQARASHSNDSDDESDKKATESALLQLLDRISQLQSRTKVCDVDLKRIVDEEWWPRSFLIAYNNDVEVAYAVLVECLKWRFNFAINRISLLELKPSLDRRLAYIHGKDHNDASILWINMRHHSTGQPITSKLLIYWLERHTMELHAAPITLFFNMSSCSLQNMDIDLVKYILRACKYYYPNCLVSVLVFENPPILSASWKLIRTWVSPEMQPLIQNTKRSSLASFVPMRFIPTEYGGQDNFVFTMDELARCITSKCVSAQQFQSVDDDQQNSDEFSQNGVDFEHFGIRRSVTFEEENDEEEPGRDTPLIIEHRPKATKDKLGNIASHIRPIAESRVKSLENANGRETIKFIAICPHDELTLNQIKGTKGERDAVDVVALKNVSKNNILYKVKITSPEKFRIRPSTGLLMPGALELIRVHLLDEYKNSFAKEKLLLLAVEVNGHRTREDFGNAWREANEAQKAEHKLRFRTESSADLTSSIPVGLANSKTVNRNELNNESTESLKRTIERIAFRQIIIIISLILIIILQLIQYSQHYFSSTSLRTSSQCHSANVVDCTVEKSIFDSEL